MIYRMLALMLGLSIMPAAAAPTANDVLDRDLIEMLDWFEGRFDNREQVYFNELMEVPEEDQHERIHSIFRKVDLPAFGKHVFYVEQYLDNDPTKVYRQRIYTFEADYERQAIALKIHSPNDPKAVLGAHKDPSKLDDLTPEAVRSMHDGCTVYWTRRANQFIGEMDEGACRIVSSRSGRTLIVDDDLVLTEQEIWIKDSAVDDKGDYVYGNKAGISHKLRKARDFVCWVSVKDEAVKGGWTFDARLPIHDQGGQIWVDGPEGEARVGLEMRNVEWPHGRNRDSLVLYALREGTKSAVSYTWTEPTGTRIAMNLRWMQASCTLAD